MKAQEYKSLSKADKCLVHRYRYYVMDDPIIQDYDYDMLEREAMLNIDKDHLLNSPGSSLRDSYPDHIIKIAE